MRAGSKLFGNHRALLSSAAGVPAWVVNGSNPPDIAFDFTNNRTWKKSGGTLSASSQLTCSRASVGYVNDASGNWASAAANQPRISNLGLLSEEARTNQIRNNSMQGAIPMADGVEKLTNGNFASAGAGWTSNGTVSFSSGNATITGDGATDTNYIAQQITGLTVGRSYVIVFSINNNSGFRAAVGSSAGDSSVLAFTTLVGNGQASASPDRAAFTATATSHWVTVSRRTAGAASIQAVSVQDGERVQNGGFTSSPINASQSTVQNGWQWSIAGGTTTTVTYASNQVTITPDNVNQGRLDTSVPTVAGVTYTLQVDIGTNLSGIAIGTTLGNNNLLSTNSIVGTGQKFQFTATGTTTWVRFYKTATGATTISNVSVQSAGALPTNWGIQANSGLLTNVVALGTESGIDYMDVQVVGTTNSTLYQLRIGEGPSQIAVTYGQTWSQSVFLKQVGGSYTNVSNFILCAFEYTSGTSFLTSDPNTTNMSNPGSSALGSQRFTNNFTVSSATAAFLMPVLQFSVANASAVNLTLRIGWPQLENNPLLNSTVASAVTAASGASGVNGTAIYQVGGGTGTAATLSVTWAAGVLTINGVNGGGSYTTFPPSPAALTYVSGTATGWTGATVNLTPSTNAAVGFPTSPIRTTAASATRATDVVTMPFTFGSAYSLYAKGTTESPTTGIETILEAYAAGTDRTSIRRNGTTNQFIASGGSGFLDTSVAGWPQNTTAKMAGAAASSDQAMSFNGAPIVATASVTLPATPTSITFGSGNNGVSFNWNGFVAEAAIWASQRVPNAQLQSITTIAPSVDLNFAAGAYTGVSGSPSSFLTTSRASTAYVNDSLGNLTLVGSNLPRISDLGLLTEESRTNIVIRSQEFDNTSAWGVPAKASTSPNATTAPDGTLTADSLIEDGTSGEHYVQQTIATQVNVPNTFSVYAKAGTGTGRYINLQLFDSTITANFSTVTVDLSSGTPSAFLNSGAAGSASVVVTPCANGWYRIAVTTTLASVSNTGVFFRIRRASANGVSGAQTSYAGDGSSFTYLWGAQLEANTTFATSYIPTTTASAVRAADVITLASPPSFGVAYSMASQANIASISGFYCQLAVDDGTANNSSVLRTNNGDIGARVILAGANKYTPVGTASYTPYTDFKHAMSVIDSVQNYAFNGSLKTAGTGTPVPTVGTRVSIGNWNGGYNNGFVKRIQLWPNNAIPATQVTTVST